MGVYLKNICNKFILNTTLTLKKEIKEGRCKWRDIPYSWVGKHNIVKISIPLKFQTLSRLS